MKITISELLGAIEEAKKEAIRRQQSPDTTPVQRQGYALAENRLDEAKDAVSAAIDAEPRFAGVEIETPPLKG
jgi:hypothetical protein